MKELNVAIMQPYFLPYLGYFHLLMAADVFIVLDDVNYIKRGFINRNRILLNQKQVGWLTLPVQKASQNKLINQHTFTFHAQDILKLIKQHYAHAPFFADRKMLLEQIITYPNQNLAAFIVHSLKQLTTYLKISQQFILSSQLITKSDSKGQERIIALAKAVAATRYINLPGGTHLYQPQAFAKHQLQLQFIDSTFAAYSQFKLPFTPRLSILDILMFNDLETITAMLNQYRLR